MEPSPDIADVLLLVQNWIEKEKYLGWDPFDGLNSPILRFFTGNSRKMGQVWVQLLKRSPINFRSILQVPKIYNPKAMGLFLQSYLRIYTISSEESALDKAKWMYRWLLENTSQGYSGYCWGYPFDWPNRGFFAKAGTPTVVNTAFIGLACCDLAGWVHGVDNSDPLATAASACEFIIKDLNRYESNADELCFSYTPLDRRYVYNANALAGQLLSTVYIHTKNEEYAHLARKTALYLIRRQAMNGSWVYGESEYDQWIDNFHTGFVLVALKKISSNLGLHEIDERIEKGYLFWKNHFFEDKMIPKYYSEKLFPVDIHSVAQGILTFLEFSDWDKDAFSYAYRIATWSIEHMFDPDGFFIYQIGHFSKNRIPYMRWSQAWMFRALSELAHYMNVRY